MRLKNCIITLFIASLAACGSPAAENVLPVNDKDQISFIVIGDTPYSEADRKMLDKAVPKIHEYNPPFIIHIGDYKGGRAKCDESHDNYHAELIDRLKPIPVFYTPGDNEWADCDRNINPETGENYSDLNRLKVIREKFFKAPATTDEKLNFTEQQGQPENQSWQYEDVQFLTLHVIGTNNARDWVTGDSLEDALTAVTAREVANKVFLTSTFERAKQDEMGAVVIAFQADPTDVKDKPRGVICKTVAPTSDHACDGFLELRRQIRDLSLDFGKPVLVIHGDTAPFTLGQAFMDEAAKPLWLLNAAGDKGRTYGVRDITLVSVNADATKPFQARGFMSGRAPDER